LSRLRREKERADVDWFGAALLRGQDTAVVPARGHAEEQKGTCGGEPSLVQLASGSGVEESSAVASSPVPLSSADASSPIVPESSAESEAGHGGTCRATRAPSIRGLLPHPGPSP